MKPKSAKAKGRRLQNYVAHKLRDEFPMLEEDDITPAVMGMPGVDIILSPTARKIIELSIECKNVNRSVQAGDVRQAEKNAYPYSLPGVVHSPQKTRLKDSLVTFRFSDFIKFYKEWNCIEDPADLKSARKDRHKDEDKFQKRVQKYAEKLAVRSEPFKKRDMNIEEDDEECQE